MKNVVFDMGNVIIRYDPAHFIEREGITDPDDFNILMTNIFRSAEWPMLDGGLLDEAELERIVFGRIPVRLHAVAHRLISGWNDPAEPIDGMFDLIRELKEKGAGLYLLSNASVRQPEYWKKLEISLLFDGAVISAFEKCAKPGQAIYKILLDRYSLSAAECVFVDDVQANVDGAVKAGMKGILFSGDTSKLRKELEEIGMI